MNIYRQFRLYNHERHLSDTSLVESRRLYTCPDFDGFLLFLLLLCALQCFFLISRVCLICSKHLTRSEIAVNRGMKTKIDSSIERHDEFLEYLKDKQSVTAHVQLRKLYTPKSSVAAA